MPRKQPDSNTPSLETLSARVVELERTLVAVLELIKDAEETLDIEAMPEGEYYGQKFE